MSTEKAVAPPEAISKEALTFLYFLDPPNQSRAEGDWLRGALSTFKP